ncbi:MAG: hypothetical protein JWN88_3122 [Frankiales bacterium]|nr:hypothetical protein [Frankiales bacterium]
MRTYLALRALAAAAFLLAVVLPPGLPAALLVVVAGITAVASCFGVNAGGPGERAGARPQDRWFDAHTAPQGDWPPFDPPVPDDSDRAQERGQPS